MKIAIVGLGKFGKEITKYLSKFDHEIIVIDSNERVVNDVVNDYDVKGFLGNGASYTCLLEAGVRAYDILIAVTSSDEINILSCLVAKKLEIKNTIARVRNPEYDGQSNIMTRDFGIDLTINPDIDTAREIYRILKFPGALKVETFGNGLLDLVEYKLDKNSSLCNKSLIEIQETYKLKMLVCIVERGEEAYIPKGNFILKENDHIYITTGNENVERVFKKIDLQVEKSKSAILIGGGKISYYLANMLIEKGFNVKIIEKDKANAKKMNESIPDALVLYADGTNQQLLLEEGIEDSSVVSLTGIDETNIVISSYAKNVNAKKVITKVSNSNYSELLETIGLDSIVSPKEVFASNVIKYVRSLKLNRSIECKSLYRLVDNKVEALEFLIVEDTNYTNIKIKNLGINKEFLIAAIIRDKKIIIPGGDDELIKGDSVIIITTKNDIKDLREIIE